MKKFNLQLIVSLTSILLLQGCMPDSLTKFQKDPPKKAAPPAPAPAPSPVVDASGNPISFTAPTKFYFYNSTSNTYYATVGLAPTESLTGVIDGSLGDSNVKSKFFEKCELDLTGNTQTRVLPSGFSLETSSCTINGTPLATSTIATEFCSDATVTTKAACEAKPLTWSSTTSTCSNPDYKYATQSDCTSAKNKWYKIGDPIPFRIILTYHDENFVQKKIKTTFNLGAYQKLTEITYSQSDKMLLSVTPSSGVITDITPTVTTTSSDGVDYNRYNIISGEQTATGVAKFVDTTLNKIGINKLVALYVDDATKFTASHFIKVVGTCSNASQTTRGSCTGTWTDSGKIGKIFSIDTEFGILYVENISDNNKYFSTNDKISNDADGFSMASYVTDADDSYIMNDTKIDNDSVYFSSKFTVTGQTNVYQTGSSYSIKPLSPIKSNALSSSNGVTYKISPALPSGLAFSASTGVISGAFASDLTPTLYTVTASNNLGSISTSFTISSITAPTDYSITNKQIITVTGTSLFRVGEDLFQPIVPPLTEASSARILKILNGNQMAIEVYNGTFLAGSILDSGSSYISQKATIIPDNSCTNTNYTTKATCVAASYLWSSGPVYYNIALTVGTTGFATGDTITSSAVVASNTNGASAKGLVAGVYTAANDILFVQYLTQTATASSTAKTFYQGDTVTNGTLSTTISKIENSFLKLILSVNSYLGSTGFVQGSDIVSNANSSAYTYYVDPNAPHTKISISDITTTGTGFMNGQTLYNHEAVSLNGAPATTISALSFDNLIVFERGKKSDFHGKISSGNGITYSISPALPPGLTLNTATGDISGTALSSMARGDYLITATNFIDSTTFATSIEVRDYFQIADLTGATSLMLHKVGDTQVNRKCRINSSDINNSSTDEKVLDVRCYLDGEEEDLFFNKLKLNGISGPGVCSYFQYEPYYFQQFNPIQSSGTSLKSGGYPTPVTVHTGCRTNNVQPPTPDLCESYYTTAAHPEYPNCDEGYLRYTELTFTEDGAGVCPALGSPTITNTDKRVYCGGMMAKCTAGPITNLLSVEAIESGHRGQIYNAPNGFTKTWEIEAPINRSYFTNISIANGTIKNQCSGSNDDADNWETATANQSGYTSPLGSFADTEKSPLSNPYYSFYCLDAAKEEVKARIRLVVRDWDRSFKIDSGIDNQSYTVPPTLMNLYNSTAANPYNMPWNSYKDWDDNYNGATPSYTGGSCGSHTAPITTAGTTGCSNNTDTTQAACVGNGGTWNSTCSGSGNFTNSQYLCELNGYVWTSNGSDSWGGTCSGKLYTSEYLCKLKGFTWSGDTEYKFPGGKL